MQSSDPEDMAWNDGKRAGWEQALNHLKLTQAKLTSAYGRIADLERQLAEARKDTERLDWLDANREVIDQAMNGGE